MKKLTATKITVKNVRIGEDIQSVRFACKARGVYVARTRNHTPIRIKQTDGKFTAGNRSGNVTAKTADKAFAHAVREMWAN